MNTNALNVIHDTANHCFTIELEGDKAVLDYRFPDGPATTGKTKKIDFTHTWVPPVARGRGLAERLVRTGLKWAREQEFEIHASCWYVAKFLQMSEKK